MGLNVLELVNTSATPSADETFVHDRLTTAGHTVTYRTFSLSLPSASTYDVIVVSNSLTTANLAGKIDNVTSGVLSLKPLPHSKFATADSVPNASSANLDILNTSDPITKGRTTGTQAVTGTAATAIYILSTGLGAAAAFATCTDSTHTTRAIGAHTDTGSLLSDGSTVCPSRRVHLGLPGGYANLNTVGLALLDNAFAYASQVATSNVANLTLSGTATVGVTSASGTLSLDGTATVTFAATGSLSLSGTAAPPVSSATGSLTLGGTAGAVPAAAAVGTLSLSATAGATTPGTASGQLTLTGTSAATARGSGAGSLTLTGNPAATGSATTAGQLTLAAAGTPSAAAAATGTLTLTATTTSTSLAAGGVLLAGTAASARVIDAAGTVTLTGTATPTTTAAATGNLTLTGASSNVTTTAVAFGALTLGGTASGGGGVTSLGNLTLTGTAAGTAVLPHWGQIRMFDQPAALTVTSDQPAAYMPVTLMAI